jgi:hypothetical protein
MGSGRGCWAIMGEALRRRDERLARGDYGPPDPLPVAPRIDPPAVPPPGDSGLVPPWEGEPDWGASVRPWDGPRIEWGYVPKGSNNKKYRKAIRRRRKAARRAGGASRVAGPRKAAAPAPSSTTPLYRAGTDTVGGMIRAGYTLVEIGAALDVHPDAVKRFIAREVGLDEYRKVCSAK